MVVSTPSLCPEQAQPWGQTRAQGVTPRGLETAQGGRWCHVPGLSPTAQLSSWGKCFLLFPGYLALLCWLPTRTQNVLSRAARGHTDITSRAWDRAAQCSCTKCMGVLVNPSSCRSWSLWETSGLERSFYYH